MLIFHSCANIFFFFTFSFFVQLLAFFLIFARFLSIFHILVRQFFRLEVLQVLSCKLFNFWKTIAWKKQQINSITTGILPTLDMDAFHWPARVAYHGSQARLYLVSNTNYLSYPLCILQHCMQHNNIFYHLKYSKVYPHPVGRSVKFEDK